MKQLLGVVCALVAMRAGADTLFDVKATVNRLAAKTPTHATYMLQRNVKTAGRFANDNSVRTVTVEVTHDANGHQFSFFRNGSAASRYASADLPRQQPRRDRCLLSRAQDELPREHEPLRPDLQLEPERAPVLLCTGHADLQARRLPCRGGHDPQLCVADGVPRRQHRA